MTDPPQCMWPLRKIATAYGQSLGLATWPPTIDARAWGAAAAPDGAATAVRAQAPAMAAISLRCRGVVIIGLRLGGPQSSPSS